MFSLTRPQRPNRILFRSALIATKRHASYTVDVYLLKDHNELGRAGSVVEVDPGLARNVLLPRKMAILMGEGQYRKKLPIIYEKVQVHGTQITAGMIVEAKQKWLDLEAVGAESWLAERAQAEA